MDRSYNGAVVVVTGASTGLGCSTAAGEAVRRARAVVINFASDAGRHLGSMP